MNIMIAELERRKESVQTKSLEYCRAIDLVIELIGANAAPGEAASQLLPQPSLVPIAIGVKISRRAGLAPEAPPPARPRKAAPRGRSTKTDGSMRQKVSELVLRLPEPFGADAICAQVNGLKRGRASDYCGQMCREGVLKRVSHGTYERANARPDRAAAEPQPPPRPSGNGAPSPRTTGGTSPGQFITKRKEGSVAAATRDVAASAHEPFTLLSILPELLCHPMVKGKRETDVKLCASQALIDMRARGVLARAGAGRPTPYVRTKHFDRQSSSVALQQQIRGEIELKVAELHKGVEE